MGNSAGSSSPFLYLDVDKSKPFMTLEEAIFSHSIEDAMKGLGLYSEQHKNDILDIKVIVPDKVVEVTFWDRTKEKAVCQEPDIFSMEQAIAICISKKIMGGSGAYNNAIRKGMKVYENKLKHEAEVKAEQERIERKRAKRKAQRDKRAAKRAEQEAKAVESEREEMINIIAEAIKRANE